MPKQCLSTNRGPKAIGPYSVAVQAGQLLFCSGLIPVDPTTGELVGDDVVGQTRQALRNLQTLLEDNNLSLRDVVKTTCFLTDLRDFAAFNEVYAEFFGADPPARSTVQVAALPRGALVEVEAVVYVGD
ncbi:MAG: RidA family protein [Armatimonadetes bacterium]|nr:RidA family protein [Armatimonadota bacterium]